MLHQVGVSFDLHISTYLGLHFNKRLTWKNHVAMKRKQLDLKTRDILARWKAFPLVVGKQAYDL